MAVWLGGVPSQTMSRSATLEVDESHEQGHQDPDDDETTEDHEETQADVRHLSDAVGGLVGPLSCCEDADATPDRAERSGCDRETEDDSRDELRRLLGGVEDGEARGADVAEDVGRRSGAHRGRLDGRGLRRLRPHEEDDEPGDRGHRTRLGALEHRRDVGRERPEGHLDFCEHDSLLSGCCRAERQC